MSHLELAKHLSSRGYDVGCVNLSVKVVNKQIHEIINVLAAFPNGSVNLRLV